MSAVYEEARDIRLGRFVALKFLLEEFCEIARRWSSSIKEARIVLFESPRHMHVHDIGRHMHRPFIVMEYLEGETLRDKSRKKKGLTMQQAVEFGVHIADVVSQAHASGIVHRDISPANLFVTDDGRIKWLDFGIAQYTGATSDATRRILTGTVNYMSPEQASGDQVDARQRHLFDRRCLIRNADRPARIPRR